MFCCLINMPKHVLDYYLKTFMKSKCLTIYVLSFLLLILLIKKIIDLIISFNISVTIFAGVGVLDWQGYAADLVCLQFSDNFVFSACMSTFRLILYTFWQKDTSYLVFGFMNILSSVAVMTRAFPDYTGVQKELVLLQNISSYLLLGCGVVYLVLVR